LASAVNAAAGFKDATLCKLLMPSALPLLNWDRMPRPLSSN
jgi:hypothetical protein